MIARSLAFAVGGLILGAVTHVQVIATGGYGTPHSYVILAVAAGVGFASVFAGMAWDAGRRVLATLFVLTIVAGEAFNLLATAERLIISREAAQKPLITDAEARARAEKRVADAMAAVEKPPTTSPRLERAMADKMAADTAVVDKSAERGCRENCRQLLQAQVDAAILEVAKAQAELAVLKEKAAAELAAARTALNHIPKPASATPLADRIGIAAWIIDLVTSALGSIAANGLACCLLVFGGHHPRSSRDKAQQPPIEALAPMRIINAEPVLGDMSQFVLTNLKPGEAVRELDVCNAYVDWCNRHGYKPVPRAMFKAAFRTLCDQSGFKRSRGKVQGMRLVAPIPRIGTKAVPTKD